MERSSHSMNSWSVGKYAKRSATIHIGSEDLLSYRPTQDSEVLDTNTGKAITLYPFYKAPRGPAAVRQRLHAHMVSVAELNNSNLYSLDLNSATMPAGATMSGIVGHNYYASFTLNTMGSIGQNDYLFCVSAGRSDFTQGEAADLEAAVVTGAGAQTFTIPQGQLPQGNQYAWADQTYDPANPNGGSQFTGVLQGIGALVVERAIEDGVNSNVQNIILDSAFQVGDVIIGDMLAMSIVDPAVYNADGYPSATNGNWVFRRVLYVGRDVGNNATVIKVLATNNAGVVVGRRYQLFRNAVFTVRRPTFMSATDSHVDFQVPVPNLIGFPEHKRCLLQVQSAHFSAQDTFDMNNLNQLTTPGDQHTPPMIGVEIMGVGPMNTFSTNVGRKKQAVLLNSAGVADTGMGCSQYVGFGLLEPIGLQRYVGVGNDIARNQRVAYGFSSDRSVVDDGVLATSPFGKILRVRFINLSTGEPLSSTTRDFDANGDLVYDGNAIENNPSHLVLKLLFIDDDEMPMR